MKPAARLALSLLAVVLGGILFTAPTFAQQSGSIEGTLINLTAGGAVPVDAEVVLHVFRNQTHVTDIPLRSDGEGRFAFSDLETRGDFNYEVTAGYGGAPYSSDLVSFGPGETKKSMELRVYEAIQTDPGLRVRRSTVLLLGVDAGAQTMQALEMATLENPSDRTYVPSQTGPAGPMGLLRFSLPPHAGDLIPGPGLESAEILQVDRGFATTLPVPPGETEILFRYRFPYHPGQSRFLRTVSYPTGELEIVVPEPGPRIESPDLVAVDLLTLGDRVYRRYGARDLPAGRQLELTVIDLPGRWPLGLPLDDVPVWAWAAGLGILALAAAVGPGVYRWRRASPAPQRAGPWFLVEEIAQLDEDFAAGRLPEAVYRARRAALKSQAAVLMGAHADEQEHGEPAPLPLGSSPEKDELEVRLGAGAERHG